MKNLLTKLRYVPKHFGMIVAILVATAGAAFAFAWGPERRTFTTANPAPYITFNSITDNPAYGDERNFMRVKPADAPNSAYSDKTALEAGKEYQVYIYFHNNAASNLNLTATKTTVQTQLPAVVNGDTQSVTYINSPDANPVKIWDETTLTSTSPMYLRMVPGSATMHSFGAVDGKTMPDSIITTGTYLGYNALDGNVPGCNQYAGYVTFRFVADQPNFEVSKLVSKHGANAWVENYTAQPGETVDYLLKYKNTGTTVQNDVLMRDQLPAGMTYIAGSSILGNPTNPSGVKTNDTVTTTGLNIGNYGAGQNAWVIFSAKAPAVDALACGTNTLINKETIDTKSGSKSDTATVTIDKTCAPTPVYTCDGLAVDTISRTEFKFTASKTVQNATYVKTVFVVRSANGTEVARVDDVDGILNYTQTTVGKYTVEAIIVVSVSGVEKTATSPSCKKPFEVQPEVVKTPHITISKKVNGAETAVVNMGENFIYTIVVTNDGQIDLKNAVVTDAAPTGISFISADKGTASGNTFSYTIPVLAIGKSETIKITAKSTAVTATPAVNKVCVDAVEIPGKDDACDTASTTTPETPTPKPVEVCDPKTGNIITVNESEAGKYEPKDSVKCKAQVCDPKDHIVKMVPKADADKYLPANSDTCVKIEVCVKGSGNTTMQPIYKDSFDSAKHSSNANDCKKPETPKIPEVIPSTGPEALLGSITGASALTYGAYTYAASRRAVRSARK